jgi:hypothetical protein
LAGGYRATGDPEMLAVWTTQGKMFDLTRDTVVAHRLPRTALLRPPVQFAWIADLAARLDRVPAKALRQGDPTLGV